jgi:hypothetical protein
MENYNLTTAYDIVTLPSNGIYYSNKKKTLKVAYLTAVDENILSSPNLMISNTIIEELLKSKILDKDIDIDELIEEDRQAVLIFLRNTAYGTTYKVTLTDPKTDIDFEVELNLEKVPVKDFTLVSDENDEFEYFMEKSKSKVKFKFLTKKQEEVINELRKGWNGVGAAPVITRQLERMIKSINGETDQLALRNIIEKLPIKDSQDFRKFVKDNKPGLDLTQTVIAPSGDKIQYVLGFGVEFFRPFYGL